MGFCNLQSKTHWCPSKPIEVCSFQNIKNSITIFKSSLIIIHFLYRIEIKFLTFCQIHSKLNNRMQSFFPIVVLFSIIDFMFRRSFAMKHALCNCIDMTKTSLQRKKFRCTISTKNLRKNFAAHYRRKSANFQLIRQITKATCVETSTIFVRWAIH